MKKRFFAVFAAVLFMGSSSFAIQGEETPECEFMAIELHNNLISLGVPHSVAYQISGNALDACNEAQDGKKEILQG